MEGRCLGGYQVGVGKKEKKYNIQEGNKVAMKPDEAS